jgi:hypothetical protein
MNRANDGKKVKAKYSGIHPKIMIKRSGRRLWHPVPVGLGLLGIALLFVVVLQVIHDSGAPHKQARIIETRSQDPKIEAAMKLIAARFNCSCGSCGEKSLDICACNRAIEERQFIRNALQTGQSEDQIIAAVNTTYGSRKPGSVESPHASVPDAAIPPGTAVSHEVTARRVMAASDPSTPDRIASSADRDEILGHFKCACGKCGMDDLSACICQHPRGAVEVKAFVDRTIEGGKISVAQIITLVDQKYGGRKF